MFYLYFNPKQAGGGGYFLPTKEYSSIHIVNAHVMVQALKCPVCVKNLKYANNLFLTKKLNILKTTFLKNP